MSTSAEFRIGTATFRTFVTALQVANLAPALDAAGPYTVFAPTDAAFARMSRRALGAIMANEAKLTEFVRSHLVPHRLSSVELKGHASPGPAAMNGHRLAIVARDGELYVNGARVLFPDVEGSNGVIHVVDAVVLPGVRSPATTL